MASGQERERLEIRECAPQRPMSEWTGQEKRDPPRRDTAEGRSDHPWREQGRGNRGPSKEGVDTIKRTGHGRQGTLHGGDPYVWHALPFPLKVSCLSCHDPSQDLLSPLHFVFHGWSLLPSALSLPQRVFSFLALSTHSQVSEGHVFQSLVFISSALRPCAHSLYLKYISHPLHLSKSYLFS